MNPGTVYPLILIAGLIVIGVLAALTCQYYKRPPREPPSSNPGPVSEAEAQAARRRELRTQVAFLSSVLNELPLAESLRISEAMLNGNDLHDFPFARFRALALEIDVATDSAAALVETNMRWLSDLIQQVRWVRSGLHYDWSRFPRVRFNEVIRISRRRLQEMAQHLE